MSEQFSEPTAVASSINLVSNLGNALITGAVFLILVNIATPEQLGLYTGIILAGEIGSLVSVMGMNEAAMWRIAQLFGMNRGGEVNATARGTVIFVTVISMSVASLIILISSFLSEALFKSVVFTRLFAPIAIGIIFQSIGTAGLGILMGKHSIRVYSMISFSSVLIGQLTGLLLFIQTSDVFMLAAGWAVTGLVSTSAVFAAKIVGNARIQVALPDKALILFSSAVLAGHLMLFLSRSTDKYLLLLFLTPYDVGIYSVPSMLWTFVSYIPMALYVSLVPKLSRIQKAGSPEEFSELLRTGLSIMISILIVVAAVVIPLSGWILSFVGGSNYLPATIPLQILSVGFPFYASTLLLAGSLKAQGKALTAAGSIFIGVATSFIVGVLAIPTLGIIGASLSNTLGQMLGATAALFFVRQYAGSVLEAKPILKLIAALAPSFILLIIAETYQMSGIWLLVFMSGSFIILIGMLRTFRVIPVKWIEHGIVLFPEKIARIITWLFVDEAKRGRS